jgi:hypothetical protein
MWMPHQMKDLNLRAMGLQMNPDDLYKKDGTGLMSAIVNLGGGTGEFVSPEGLVLTNHHVAYGAIQRASSKEKDYINNGFMAAARGEEIPAQGYQAGVLLGYEDVTAKVNAYFKPGMTPRQRYDAYDKAQKELIAAGEKAGQDLRCTLAAMYTGPGQEVRRGPGRPRSFSGQAKGLWRQDGTAERGPGRVDHPVPGLQHRAHRGRDPETG